MADIEVIYDPQKEYAAIVNIDTRAGWGPAMVGPNAGAVLQLWVDAMPFDVTLLSDTAAQAVFADWLQQLAASPPEVPDEAPAGPLEPSDDPGVVGDALAQATAAASGSEPPEPQPADTDLEADQGASPTVVGCPLCSGEGFTVDDQTGEQSTCAMCSGTGLVRMAVPS